MEPLYFIWLLILSLVVFSHSSTVGTMSRSLGQIRSWIDAVVAQSQAGAAPVDAAAAEAVSVPIAAAPATPTPSPTPATFASSASGEEQGGRVLAIVGVLAMVAAGAFAVKYAIDEGWLTEGLRMALGTIVGLGLAFAGNALRARLGWFGDAILGLGLGLLYLTVYSGYVFFDFYGYGFALAAAVMVSALSAILAVSAKVEAPAALGAAGAFLTAVILPMTASPSAVAFAFAVAAVSLAAAVGTGWRATQMVALLGGALVFAEFLVAGYDQSAHFWFVETFGLLFVALFTFAGYGWSALRGREPSTYDIGLSVAATLLFAPVTIALAADYSENFDGFLPLFLALAYGTAALWGYAAKASRLANGASLGLAAAFLATAISLQLDGAWVAILWAAEAVALAALAYQTRAAGFAALSGALGLMALAATSDVSLAADDVPVWNVRFACFLAVLVAGWTLASVARVVSRMPGKGDWRTGFAFVAVLSHVIALGVLAAEVDFAYQPKIEAARSVGIGTIAQEYDLDGNFKPRPDGRNLAAGAAAHAEVDRLESSRSTAIAIVWGLYGAIILVVGFAVSSAPSRYAGVGTLLLAAGDVFLIVWDLGTGYRIVASFAVGVLALGGAYLFARYRHRITGKA